MLSLLSLPAAHIRTIFFREEGQDLVEYALVVALVALGATAAMNTLATDLASAFSSIGTTINGDV